MKNDKLKYKTNQWQKTKETLWCSQDGMVAWSGFDSWLQSSSGSVGVLLVMTNECESGTSRNTEQCSFIQTNFGFNHHPIRLIEACLLQTSYRSVILYRLKNKKTSCKFYETLRNDKLNTNNYCQLNERNNHWKYNKIIFFVVSLSINYFSANNYETSEINLLSSEGTDNEAMPVSPKTPETGVTGLHSAVVIPTTCRRAPVSFLCEGDVAPTAAQQNYTQLSAIAFLPRRHPLLHAAEVQEGREGACLRRWKRDKDSEDSAFIFKLQLLGHV